MLTKSMWKSTIEIIRTHKDIFKDEKKYDDYFELIMTIFASLFLILIDVILFPFEIIGYLVYKKI